MIKVIFGKCVFIVIFFEEDGWVVVSVMVEKKWIVFVMDDFIKVGVMDIFVLDIYNICGS